MHDELHESSQIPFDTVEGSEDIAGVDHGEEAVQQELELDEAEVRNLPATEAEQPKEWTLLPQRICVALHWLRRQFGRCP